MCCFEAAAARQVKWVIRPFPTRENTRLKMWSNKKTVKIVHRKLFSNFILLKGRNSLFRWARGVTAYSMQECSIKGSIVFIIRRISINTKKSINSVIISKKGHNDEQGGAIHDDYSLVVWWTVLSLKKQPGKHNSNVAAMFWSPWAQFDASDRRFNPADIFWVVFFFFLLLCPLGQNIIPIWNKSKWNTIMLMITISTAKFVCMPMGRRTQETQNQVVIYYKKKEEIVTQFNKSFVHTYASCRESHTLPNHFFFPPRGHRQAKGDLRYSQRFGRWPTVIWVSIYALYRTYFPFGWKSIFYLFYVQHTAVMPRIDNNVDYICDTIITNVGICMKSSLKNKKQKQKPRSRLLTVPVSRFDRTIIPPPDKRPRRRPDFLTLRSL